MNGTVGVLEIAETYYAKIIGIDHNKELEGSKTIHFQFPYDKDGMGLAFVDDKYLTYVSNDSSAFMMNGMPDINTYGSTVGGWSASYGRLQSCSQFLNILNSGWKSIVKDCMKYRDNTANKNDIASYVTSTNDKVWYLAEFEVQGSRTNANSYEQNFQKQYDFYKNGGIKIRYKHNSPGSTSHWWLASATVKSSSSFCSMLNSGSCSFYASSLSLGVVPCFAVA